MRTEEEIKALQEELRLRRLENKSKKISMPKIDRHTHGPDEAKKEALELKRRNLATSKALMIQRRQGIGFLAEVIAQFPGGMKSFEKFVKAAPTKEPTLIPLVDSFMNLSANARTAFKLEEMCRDLAVSPHHLLGICVEVASETQHDVTRMLTYLAMPSVMKRNISEAKKVEGLEDRRMFMQSTGILPVPKGSTINVAALSGSASLTKEGQPTGLPTFEDSTVSFSEVIRRAVEVPRQALPEPSLTVEAEEE